MSPRDPRKPSPVLQDFGLARNNIDIDNNMIDIDRQSTTDEIAMPRAGIRVPRHPEGLRVPDPGDSPAEPLRLGRRSSEEPRLPRASRLRVVERPNVQQSGPVAAALVALQARCRPVAASPDVPNATTREPQPFHSAEPAIDSTESDRRAYPRRDSGCSVSVARSAENGATNPQMAAWQLHSSQLKGALLDISMNGVAFLIPEPLAEDEDLFLRLSNRSFDKQIDTSARVVRIFPDADEQWKIVCKFHKRLSFEQVHDFGRHLFHSDIV